MNRDFLPPLPLLHDGDSYIIYLKEVGQKCVKILQLHRYANNDSRNCVEESFGDLAPETKQAVILQVNRRHQGKTVLV